MAKNQNDKLKAEAEIQRQRYENMVAERFAFFERWRIYVEPVEADRKAFVRYAVEHAQIGIRSGFILNGGAIIAVPAFAELLGDGLWARGPWWPAVMMLVFFVGLAASNAATVYAFFAMDESARRFEKSRDRNAKAVRHDFDVAIGANPTTNRAELETEDAVEAFHRKNSDRQERRAFKTALSSLFAFFIGSLVAVYIISGAPSAKTIKPREAPGPSAPMTMPPYPFL